jgi:hypothetical protein
MESPQIITPQLFFPSLPITFQTPKRCHSILLEYIVGRTNRSKLTKCASLAWFYLQPADQRLTEWTFTTHDARVVVSRVGENPGMLHLLPPFNVDFELNIETITYLLSVIKAWTLPEIFPLHLPSLNNGIFHTNISSLTLER